MWSLVFVRCTYINHQWFSSQGMINLKTLNNLKLTSGYCAFEIFDKTPQFQVINNILVHESSNLNYC